MVLFFIIFSSKARFLRPLIAYSIRLNGHQFVNKKIHFWEGIDADFADYAKIATKRHKREKSIRESGYQEAGYQESGYQGKMDDG
jgi:hypothetical protein